MNNFIAIDFGTTACRIAHDHDGSFEIIPNRFLEGKMHLLVERLDKPSSDKVIGAPFPFRFSSVKQKIGFEEKVDFDNKKINVIDLAADIFRGLKDDARINRGEAPTRAIITIPANFAEKQRAAMRTAAEKAGFSYVKLLDEATAVLLGSVIKDEGKAFIVYSLGGGIFTASIFRIINGMPKALCHEGDRNLGGQKFDLSLVQYVMNLLAPAGKFKDHSIEAVFKLKPLAERLKLGLSKKASVGLDINIGDYIDKAFVGNVNNNLNYVLSRNDFEEIITNDVKETLELTKKAIQGAELTIDDIEAIIIVGGSTKIPLVERMISDEFGKKIVQLSSETLLKGATIYGQQLPEPSVEKAPDQHENVTELISEAGKPEPTVDTLLTRDKNMSWLREFSPYLLDAQKSWNAGKQDEAIQNLLKMTKELHKFMGNLFFTRAEMLLKWDKFEEAKSAYKHGLIIDGDNKMIKQAYHKACSGKGRQLVEKGQLHDALAILKEGLTIKSDCEGCIKLIKEIESALRSKSSFGFKLKKNKK